MNCIVKLSKKYPKTISMFVHWKSFIKKKEINQPDPDQGKFRVQASFSTLNKNMLILNKLLKLSLKISRF